MGKKNWANKKLALKLSPGGGGNKKVKVKGKGGVTSLEKVKRQSMGGRKRGF